MSSVPPAVIHLDLDSAATIFRAHGWNVPNDPDTLFFSGMKNALSAFESWGVTATLFVVASDLRDASKREVLREAVRRGHEVGSHTYTHRPLTSLSAGERQREVADSRHEIAARLGVSVDGFRAPGFHMDDGCFTLIREAGYRYDSSVFEGSARARRLQLIPRGGPQPIAGHGELHEVPLPQYRPLPLPYHPSYSLVLGMWYFWLGLRRQVQGAPFTLLFHLTDFADPVTDRWARGLRRRVYTISHRSAEAKRRACSAMFEAVRTRYRIVTTSALLSQSPRLKTVGGVT